MIIAIIVCVFLVALVVAGCCKVSGECSRQEEQEDPCASCPRLSECKGVSDAYPWRCDDGN